MASRLGDKLASYHLAKYYEQPSNLNLSKAFYFYAKAALQRHNEAKNYLVEQANQQSVEAQYAMGHHYYLAQQAMPACFEWLIKAARQGHTHAKNYLEQTDFSLDNLLILAQLYESGDVVPGVLEHAIIYYRRAAGKQHLPSVLKLAEIGRAHV